MFETVEKNIFELSTLKLPVESASAITYDTQQLVLSSVKTADPTEEKSETGKLRKPFCSLFVIFGLNATKFVNEDFKQSYEVLDSYPDLQRHPEVAADHKFVQDLQMICFPEVQLEPERFHLSRMDPVCRYSFFHFISTNDMGEKKYLTSIHFKEILLSERGAFVIDKSICVASALPIFSLQRQVLQQIFHRVVLKNNDVSIKAFKEAQRTYEACLDEY